MTALANSYLRSAPARWVALVAFAIGAFLFIFVFPNQPMTPYRIDFDVYRTGAQYFLDGGRLYDQLPQLSQGAYLPFTYPPIAAVLFTVFTIVPVWVGSAIFTAISIGLLFIVMRLVMSRILDRTAAEITWLVLPFAAVALWLGPVRDTLTFGQVNILLMALVVIDALVGRGRWWRGLLVGLAIAIKLTPFVFLLFFVLRRDWRAAVVSVVSALAFHGIGYLLAPKDSVQYWTESLIDTDRIGSPIFANNQSINGELQRLGIDSRAVWFLLALIVGLFIAWVAWQLMRAGTEVGALLVVAMSALFCSPLSWDQHWVWVAPLMMAMTVWGIRTVLPGAVAWWFLVVAGIAIFLIVPHQRVPNRYEVELTWTWWQHLIGSTYLIWGLAVLVALGAVAARLPRDVAPQRELEHVA